MVKKINIGTQLQKKVWGKKMPRNLCRRGGGGVGRLMVNVVLNFQFNIFCILPLVEEYKVDLFELLCWDYFVFSPSSSFCICNFVALLMASMNPCLLRQTEVVVTRIGYLHN